MITSPSTSIAVFRLGNDLVSSFFETLANFLPFDEDSLFENPKSMA